MNTLKFVKTTRDNVRPLPQWHLDNMAIEAKQEALAKANAEIFNAKMNLVAAGLNPVFVQ